MDRRCLYGIIFLLIICLLGALSFALVVLILPSPVNVSPHKDIFNSSVVASFVIDEIEKRDIGTEKTYLIMEWNSELQKMNFKHTEVFSSNFDFDYNLSLVMADDKATIGLSNTNESLAFCIEDLSISSWLGVLQHIVSDNNWLGGSKAHGCRGNLWYTKHKKDIIELCIFNKQLEYIVYQKIRATVTSWTHSDRRTIHIESNVLNGPCRNVTPLTCNLPTHPKIKRDSGLSPKTCLFVHGAGNPASGNSVSSSMSEYWGDIHTHTTNCDSHKFLIYNSKDNGWDTDQIHEHFCNVAATNGTIKNTVLFSHSMGNLVIAAALHRKKCTFHNTSSHWFSVEGPWTGSVVADTLSDICRKPSWIQKLIRSLLRSEGYCKPTDNSESDVYTTLKTNYVSPTGMRFDDLVTVGRKYVSGVMCGTSSWGQGADYTDSAALWIMQKYSDLEKPNDGMVAFDSCKLMTSVEFDTHSSYPFYKGEFNHADGTCRNGGCPCRWYDYMH
ncbi:uncharacterized protein [Argopecten irradians]|uniref:uncharacterized protein isoform X2 n=1 Tax=Argopecten irradians TaxID=31199 RepID=UPI00371D6183